MPTFLEPEMTEDEAREQIAMLTQWDQDPKLSMEELAYLTRKSRRIDVTGFYPVDAEWTPTFNVMAGVALGWELKAAKAVACSDFSSGGVTIRRSQIIKNCREQAAYFRRRVHDSVVLPGSLSPHSGSHIPTLGASVNLPEFEDAPY